VDGDADRVLDDVAADRLALDKVGPIGIVGRQDAGRVGAKELGVRRSLCELGGGANIVGFLGVLVELKERAAMQIRLC